MEIVYVILAAFLGWIFGLASSGITDWLRRRSRRTQFKSICVAEMESLQLILVGTVCRTLGQFKGFDASSFDWFIKAAEKTNFLEVGILSKFKRVQAEGDAGITEWNRVNSAKSSDAIGQSHLSLTCISANLDALKLFDKHFSKHIISIITQLEFLNEAKDIVWFYYTKTFDQSLSDKNREIINNNMDMTYTTIGNRAKLIYDKIDVFLAENS